MIVSLELYSLESLRAAAGALKGRAKVSLKELEGRRCRVTLSRPALAGELLNEALSSQLRLMIRALALPALAPILDGALARGLAEPEDFIERMEPQAAADRRRETEGLLAEARRRGAV